MTLWGSYVLAFFLAVGLGLAALALGLFLLARWSIRALRDLAED